MRRSILASILATALLCPAATASADQPALKLMPVNFGSQPGTDTITVVNRSDGPVRLQEVSLLSITPGFGLTFRGSCIELVDSSDPLPAGESCDAQIQFSPLAAGPHEGRFCVNTVYCATVRGVSVAGRVA